MGFHWVKEPGTAPGMAKRFARARAVDMGEILETLCAVGKARHGKTDGTKTSNNQHPTTNIQHRTLNGCNSFSKQPRAKHGAFGRPP